METRGLYLHLKKKKQDLQELKALFAAETKDQNTIWTSCETFVLLLTRSRLVPGEH